MDLPNSGVVVSGPALKAFTAKKLSPSSASVSVGSRAITAIRHRNWLPKPWLHAPDQVLAHPCDDFRPTLGAMVINDGWARVFRVATMLCPPVTPPAPVAPFVGVALGVGVAVAAGVPVAVIAATTPSLWFKYKLLVKHSASVASSSSSTDGGGCWRRSGVSHRPRVKRLDGRRQLNDGSAP